VNEDVWSLILGDEPIAFLAVEPLHRAGSPSRDPFSSFVLRF
jgi:hypothetical protein